MAMPKQPANPYLKTQVETASKEQLVVMLFDGIIRFSETARKHMEKKEIEETHHNLMRAQAIVMELIYTVDKEKGGEIAENLLALHAYAYSCLVNANMYKDTKKIDEVQHIYRELREGWIGAMQSLGLSPTAQAGPATPAAAPATGKTLGSTAPKAAAPAMPPKPAAPTTGYGPGKTMIPPTNPQGSSLQAPSLGKTLIPGIPAAASAPSAAAPAIPPAPVKPNLAIPAQPQAGGLYGMGKTAMPAASQTPVVPAMPKAPVNAYAAASMASMNTAKPAITPAAAVPPAANANPGATAATPNQQQKSAMLSAYNKGRSIA